MWNWIRALPAAFLWRLSASIAIYVTAFAILAAVVWRILGASPIRPAGLAFAALIVVVGGMAFISGLVVAYNAAAALYRPPAIKPTVTVTPSDSSANTPTTLNYSRIGIILSGGGAKGAYQAGALRAVYEFLEQHRALDRVKMIAGTSIGSWNAMFWLAGLVKAPLGGRSAHEEWWSQISLERIATFATYRPFQPWLFKTTPWEETFLHLFRDTPAVRERLDVVLRKAPPLHFYFTRTNVSRGTLEFTTNRSLKSLETMRRVPAAGGAAIVPANSIDVIDTPNFDRLRAAVFASMDLPPLFPYASVAPDAGVAYEDGGVVANLPVWFGTHVEECDLLFVLALNASFATPTRPRSVLGRLIRALDVRQGVLEYEAMRGIHDRNELIGARNEKARADKRPDAALISVFAVCPGAPLIIDTTQFWAATAASRAFVTMYKATSALLASKFKDLATPGHVALASVSSQGEVSVREII